MKTYRVVAHMTISVHTDVVEKSKREARRMARERSVMNLCHQCADGPITSQCDCGPTCQDHRDGCRYANPVTPANRD